MAKVPNHTNYALFEWNTLEELNTELYEAMLDDESEDIVTTISKIRYRLSDIYKDHKEDKKR